MTGPFLLQKASENKRRLRKEPRANPAGKKPGTLNGTTVALKEQILHALDQAA
jgi:hypothetical protein